MKNNKKKGFTLIELLVVIAILAILATVSIVGYTSFLNKANRSVDQQLVDQINTVIAAEAAGGSPIEDFTAVQELLTENGFTSPLTPAFKGYTFSYLANEKVMVLVEDNQVVYPVKYAGTSISSVELTVESAESLKAAATMTGNIALSGDVSVNKDSADAVVYVKNDNTVVSLGSNKITVNTPGNHNWNGLRIEGENVVLNATTGGIVCADNPELYAMTVGSLSESATLTINGGTYVGGTTAVNLVKGTVIINGGTFKVTDAETKYTLNRYDAGEGEFIVAGGMFYKFNPAESLCGTGEVRLADGCTVVRCNEDGTANEAGEWYKVVKAN